MTSIFECGDCGEEFDTHAEATEHVIEEHVIILEKCSECEEDIDDCVCDEEEEEEEEGDEEGGEE